MARPLRIEYPGAFYHVLNRGLERREIFKGPKDYESFFFRSLEIHKRFKVIFHAYSLMPNHYHLMVETPEGNLSRAMRHLDGVYTQGFNQRYKRVGPLFQGRYKAVLVEKESYSLELSRYIHLNPVKAGIVKRPEDHPHSSFRHYLARGKQPEFLETDWLLGQFHQGGRGGSGRFYQFTLDGLKADWMPEERLQGGAVLGSGDFFEKIRRKYLEGRQDGEIPILRRSQKIPGLKEIQACIESCVDDQGMRKRFLVWALKRHTPLKLREIAERSGGGISYSAVSQICRRLEKESQKNRTLQTMIRRIETEVSKVNNGTKTGSSLDI